MKRQSIIFAVLVCAVSLWLTACGGGTTPPPPPPPPPAASVTCVNQIQIGVVSANYTCTANVAVTWSVDNTALATINASGVLTPNDTTTGTVTVTGTPTGSDKPGTATVMVVDQIIYGVGGTQVWLVDSDGSNSTQLTAGCFDPEFFADHLRFVCLDDTGDNLLVYKTTGTASGTKLSATLTWSSVIQPNLASPSPNGATLVFIGLDASSHAQGVYQSNVDGTNLQLLSQEADCKGACVGIGQPRYSYDGTKIVFTHVIGGVSMVCTMMATGADQSCITAGGDGAFSTDGTLIFFSEPDGVHSIGSGGGAVSGLIIANAGAAMSSPNGQKLVFGTGSSAIGYSVSTSYIDGSGEKTLAAGGHGSW